MPISGTGKAHTTYHDKSKIEQAIGNRGLKLSRVGATTSTVESDHEFQFAMKGYNYYLQMDSFVNTSATTRLVQQSNTSGTITYKTSNGRTSYSNANSEEDSEPRLDFVMLFPDAYYKDVIFTLPDVKESEDEVTITGNSVVTVFSKGKFPNLLSKSLRNEGQLVWTREYCDFVKYRDIRLPQTVIERSYASGNKLFRTCTYHIKYEDKGDEDERITRKIELPKGATKGDLNKPF